MIDYFKFEPSNETIIVGPTLEGVGFYPSLTKSLQFEGKKIWCCGDCSGLFRGIVSAMVSGIYVAKQIIKMEAI